MKVSNESSPEIVLMTCGLLVCFDMLQNHPEPGLRQMSSGLYLFFEWHAKHRTDVGRASSRMGGRSTGLMAPLKRIFEIMMLEIVCLIDTMPRDWHFMTPELTPLMPPIPPTFRSIDEAKDCLNSCLCALFHGVMTSHIHGLGN
jgi:hypothetical protein